ncbi:Type IV pilus biogenesis protein PilO [Klebsiella pneumoniae]|nr:Type IV pilus biogenesis protein PilO [Klebsiella pneumoniae]
MRINLRGAWTGLPILIAMGLSGGGVALWRDLRPPQAAVTRDAALQTQWRRIMALRISGEENPGARIDTQSFSPIAIPLSGVIPRAPNRRLFIIPYYSKVNILQ